MGAMVRPLALMCAFVVGWFVPQGAALSWTIPWFVRFMLFMVFLGLNVHKMAIRRSHLLILILNIVIGAGSFYLTRLLGAEYQTLALAAFFTGMAPTATAAPAIANFLKRDVEYVVTGLLLTTFGVAAALPILLPKALMMGTTDAEIVLNFWDVFQRVAGNVTSTIVAPILAARLWRWIVPSSKTWTKRFKNWTFGAWVLMVTTIACRASEFIRNPANGVGTMELLEIGAFSLGICAINFLVGLAVGEKGLREEASQTLGQKNTGAMIYFASLYANPLVALGPTIYVLWHNTWNAIQLEAMAIKERREGKKEEEETEEEKTS